MGKRLDSFIGLVEPYTCEACGCLTAEMLMTYRRSRNCTTLACPVCRHEFGTFDPVGWGPRLHRIRTLYRARRR